MKVRKQPWKPVRRLVMFLVIGGAVLLSACATIFTGTTDTLTFNSEMSPVKVFIDSEYKGETPLTVEVGRRVSSLRPVVRFEKNGYTPQEFPLKKTFNWIAISDITSTIVSGGVDLLTGALMEYNPLIYNVTLLPQAAEKQGPYKRKILIDQYAIANFSSLMRELAVGEGTLLKALPEVVLIQDSHRDRFTALIGKNRKELMKSAHGLDFIETLNRLMIQDPILREDRMDLQYWDSRVALFESLKSGSHSG